MRKVIYLVLILAVGVLGCPGDLNDPPCDTNDCCIATASCIPQTDDNWCTLVDPMNIEIEAWLQASVGKPFQVNVTAVGGYGPYTWKLTRGDEGKLEWLTIEWNEDGSTAYLVNRDGEFPTIEDIGDIDLTIRLNDVSIKGTDNRVDNQGFFLEKTLTIVDTVASPTFDPDSGTYNNDQQVSISCDAADAKIFYTTNGEDPTTSSTEYTLPILVAGDQTTMTIKAISAKAGLANSMIVEGTYIISYGHIFVIYHGNGNTSGDVPIDPTDYNYGQQVVVLDEGGLLKTGHIFACWNTKSDGTGEDYAPESIFNIGEDNVNLYAQWTPIQYTVTFDSQDGSTVDPQTVNYGDKATKPEDPTQAGYFFGGWYKEPDCIHKWVFETDTVTADVTLYAKWMPILYSVVYHGNGNTSGAVPSDSTDYENGQQVIVLNQGTLLKTGHIFACWNTKSDGTGEDYAPESTFNIGEDNVNLYAQWMPIQYTVTFDSQGSDPVASQTVNYGDKATKPEDPTQAGYFFGGWYKESGCTTVWNFDSDTVTANVTLYAKWIYPTQTQTLGGVEFYLKYVSGGTFPTGTNDKGGYETVSNAFWIGETEVTYELWCAVRDWATSEGSYNFANPGAQGYGAGTTDQHPVTEINWRDMIVWCNAASEMAGGAAAGYGPVYKYDGAVVRDSTDETACDEATADSTAKGFRLPLSMEWECAARYRGADNTNSILMDGVYWTKGNSASGATASYEDDAATGSVAWYSGNSDRTTHTVKEKTANTLGVYDMSGNVWESCFDIFAGSYRVARGGGLFNSAVYLQLSYVSSGGPDTAGPGIGFRFIRTL